MLFIALVFQPGMDSYSADHYHIYVPAKQLPGMVASYPVLYKIERPRAGTYLPGTILIKTKGAHTVGKGDVSLSSDPINRDLFRHGVKSIEYAVIPHALASNPDKDLVATGLDRLFSIAYSEPKDPFDLARELMANPDVEYAIPVMFYEMNFRPNDSRYGNQGYLSNVKMEEAWDISKGSKDIVIAIVDSGTDWQHSDLKDKIFVNKGEIPNNGIDDDNNGFVDDVRGWDFVGNVTPSELMQGILRPDNDPRVVGTSFTDNQAHGTMTAGLAAAATNNNLGIAGAGFDCTILPIKCGSDNPNVGNIIMGYQAIRYAADLGAHIINCSWGGTGADPAAQEVVNYATLKGSLVVTSSGNVGFNTDDIPFYPGSYANVLNVGSIRSNNMPSDFSNFGWDVHVYAPGENTETTFPPNTYKRPTGTSFSSPIVSGIAGLLKTLRPTWSPLQILHQIRGTSQPITGFGREGYYGRADAHAVLTTNASFSSGTRLPGMYVRTFSTPNGMIQKTGNIELSASIVNVLAPAAGASVRFQSLDPWASISSGELQSLGNLGTDEEKSISLQVKISEYCPWGSGYVRIGVTMQSGPYVNHQLLRLPLLLPTNNSFGFIFSLQNTTFLMGAAPDGGNPFWAIGRSGNSHVILRFLNGSSSGGALVLTPRFIAAPSQNGLLIAGTNGTQPAISHTVNAGGSFNIIPVASITTAIHGLVVLDANTALFVGDPVSKAWGIGRTTDGGATWTAFGRPLDQQTGEKIVEGSVTSRGNAVYYLTTNNRVIRSANGGNSWFSSTTGISGAAVLSIGFSSETNGVILYRSSGGTLGITATTDGGITWKTSPFMLSNLPATPVRLMSASGHVAMLCNGGELYGTDDNGTSWRSILGQNQFGVGSVTGWVNSSNHGVGFFGSYASRLLYTFSAPNLVISPDTINFPVIDTGQLRTRSFIVSNTGDQPLRVTNFSIVPPADAPNDTTYRAFEILTPWDSTVLPGSTSYRIRISAEGRPPGLYRGVVEFQTEKVPNNRTVALNGRVTLPTSVADDNTRDNAPPLAPNPANESVILQLTSGCELAECLIVNIVGIVLPAQWQQAGNTATINLRGLDAGTYQLTYRCGAQWHSKVFTVLK